MELLKIFLFLAFSIAYAHSAIIGSSNQFRKWNEPSQISSHQPDIDEQTLANEEQNVKELLPKHKRYPFIHWHRPHQLSRLCNNNNNNNNNNDNNNYNKRICKELDPLELSESEPFTRYRRQAPVQGNVMVQHTPHYGTDVSAAARARLWQSQNQLSQLHGTGQYSRHFGGQSGTGKPNYGVGLLFTHRF